MLYHGLYDSGTNTKNYDIGRDEFDRQIRYLCDNNFIPLVASDSKLYKITPERSSNKPVLVTFDDGSISDYRIGLHVLKNYNFTASFFITTDWIGRKGYMTWNQLQEMSELGMSIQSHGKSHSFLSDLDNTLLFDELKKSRDLLRSRLERSIDYLSIPGGFYTKRVLAKASSVGYRGVFTSVPGINKISIDDNEFSCFHRFVITRRTSFEDFKSIVNGNPNYIGKIRIEHMVKALVKKMLGSKIYYTIWSKYFRDIKNSKIND